MSLMSEQVERWEAHCREAGHKPVSEGGNAVFNRSFQWTRISCNECDWEHQDKEALAELDRAT